ncbi:hypothetical protein SAMN05216197_1736, partial [Pseudomonas graminis]
AALVGDIAADGGHGDVATGDDAARFVDDVVAREQVQAVAG